MQKLCEILLKENEKCVVRKKEGKKGRDREVIECTFASSAVGYGSSGSFRIEIGRLNEWEEQTFIYHFEKKLSLGK